MLITKTPYRLSLFGGGSDTRNHLHKSGHKVLNAAINQYSHCLVRKLPNFFESKHRLVYSKVENINHFNQSSHPVLKVIFNYLNEFEPNGLEIIHSGDLPARSGVGSSSAFTVGLLNALNFIIKEKKLDPLSLANSAITIERDLLKESGGIQDQICAAYGGISLFKYCEKNGIIHNVPSYSKKLEKIIEKNFYLGYIPRSKNS